MRIMAEPGRFGPGAPHIEDRAALNAGARANGSFVSRGGDHRHPGQAVRHATADTFHRTDGSRKNLTFSADFHTRFDDVADTGDARVFVWHHDLKARLVYAAILQHEVREIVAIQLQSATLIAVEITEANLAHWKICHLELYSVSHARLDPTMVLAARRLK